MNVRTSPIPVEMTEQARFDAIIDAYGQLFRSKSGFRDERKRAHEANVAMSELYPWWHEAILAAQDGDDAHAVRLMRLCRMRRLAIRREETAPIVADAVRSNGTAVHEKAPVTGAVLPSTNGAATSADDVTIKQRVADLLCGYLASRGWQRGRVDISMGVLAYVIGSTYSTVYNSVAYGLRLDGLKIDYDKKLRCMFVDATKYPEFDSYIEYYNSKE